MIAYILARAEINFRYLPLRRPRRALRPTTAFMESEPAGLLPGPPYKPLAAYNRPCTI